MACYKMRIDAALGHPRSTRILLPMECIGNMRKSIKQLEQKITEHERQFTEYERKITELQGQLQQVKGQLQRINKHLLKTMRTNLLTDFVKKICGKPLILLHPSKIRWDMILATDAASINRKKLLKAEVDPKYVAVLKNFSWVN